MSTTPNVPTGSQNRTRESSLSIDLTGKPSTMNAVELIRRLHQHRVWVNERLLSIAETLSDKALRKSLPIGQGSVWKSLLHLYAAEFVWLETLLGNESPVADGDLPGQLPGNQAGHGACQSLAELHVRWARLQGRWDSYLQGLSEKELEGVVYKVSTSSGAGRRFGSRRADILLHVCTHAQYTTAQVVNMFRQLGIVSLPDVMLITLARQELAT